MVIDYVPKACKERKEELEEKTKDGKAKSRKTPPTFSGKLRIRVPTFDEKYCYLEESGLEMTGEGTIDASGVKGFKSIRSLVAASKKHYEEVSLKRLSDGVEFKAFEQMESDPTCEGVLIEIGMSLVSGFKPSKN